jgi:hypothetical protein
LGTGDLIVEENLIDQLFNSSEKRLGLTLLLARYGSPDLFPAVPSELFHEQIYPRETVVSEKLEAMVRLGIANSRMKDFHDLHTLSNTLEFDGKTLTEDVRATFKLSNAAPGCHWEAYRLRSQRSFTRIKHGQAVERFLQQEQAVCAAIGIQRNHRSPRIVPRPCNQVSATGTNPGQHVDARSGLATSSRSITPSLWSRNRSILHSQLAIFSSIVGNCSLPHPFGKASGPSPTSFP